MSRARLGGRGPTTLTEPTAPADPTTPAEPTTPPEPTTPAGPRAGPTTLAIVAALPQRQTLVELVTHLTGLWQFAERPEQRPPPGATFWNQQSGRGSGKSRTGAEVQLDRAEDLGARLSGSIVGRTANDAMHVCVRAMRTSARKRGITLAWSPSRLELTHPNGACWRVSSGETPDSGRGQNTNSVWMDEIAHYAYPSETLEAAEMAMRADAAPIGRLMHFTSTPNRNAMISFQLAADKNVVTTRGATVDNAANLAPGFVEALQKKYGGSLAGEQELAGALIGIDGAVVSRDVIHRFRDQCPEEVDTVVMAIDPGGHREGDDLTGIVVVARDGDDFYVVADDSVSAMRPRQWARHAIAIAQAQNVGVIVFEATQQEAGLHDALELAIKEAKIPLTDRPKLVAVKPTKSKRDRAEPIAMLIEQGKVHFPENPLADLEREFAEWVPVGRSPDRLDACVHALAYAVEHKGGGSRLDGFLAGLEMQAEAWGGRGRFGDHAVFGTFDGPTRGFPFGRT